MCFWVFCPSGYPKRQLFVYICGMKPGEVILNERKSRGLSQAELARMSGVCLSTIQNIENGRGCSFDSYDRLCLSLGLRLVVTKIEYL